MCSQFGPLPLSVAELPEARRGPTRSRLGPVLPGWQAQGGLCFVLPSPEACQCEAQALALLGQPPGPRPATQPELDTEPPRPATPAGPRAGRTGEPAGLP